MRKFLAVMIVLLYILVAANVLIVEHNRSKWGYQIGDAIEYKNSDGTNWTTTRVVNIQPVDIVLEEKGLIWGNYADNIRSIEKSTQFLFSEIELDSLGNITHLADESVTLPWGKVTCQVIQIESSPVDYHYKYWLKNGVMVKGMVWGGYLNMTDQWQLVDLSPHLRLEYLGVL
jgi:hypothetical protein